MKLRTALITTALVCAWSFAQAQDAATQQNDQSQSQADQSSQVEQKDSATQDNEIISEPSGAERPQGRPFTEDKPPGRAFSETNPPPGRPFQEETGPQGRPFEKDQVDEPAGAEKPDAAQEDTSKDISEPSGAEADQSKPAGIEEPAGAQSGQSSKQLSEALGKIKTSATGTEQNIELKQAIKAQVKSGTTIPDEFVDRLSRDLSMSFNNVQINETVRMEIANSLNTILTAQPGSTTQVNQALSTIQSTLIQNGVSRPAARSVVCDLHLIATELVPGLEVSLPTAK